MKPLAILKLIIRSWWRNKVFFSISVVSLAVGMACTNLLFTYFVHDYNIESGNRDKRRIFCLQQDNPMQEGSKVAYAVDNIPPLLKERYAEIEDYLRINALSPQYCRYKEETFRDVNFICADTTLTHFFSYQSIAGSLKQALSQPDKIALSENFAQKVFHDENPLGSLLEVKGANGIKKYEVVAVVGSRSQLLLRFDMLTGIDNSFFGGTTFLKIAPDADYRQLAGKINKDKVPTLVPGTTRYYVSPLSDIYFVTPASDAQQTLPYINQSNVQLLYISLFSALLILSIACCNYTNMSLSRTLQQLKMIHVEKLMGSSVKDIRLQLFGDTFLTVLLAFALSLLIINDSLPFFNELLTSRLGMPFFFSMQMMPLLLLFVLIMAVIPAWYVSHKLSRLSLLEYKTLYGGRRKQRFIMLLVIFQFAISIGLIFAALIANGQIGLIQKRAYCYENRIEIGGYDAPPAMPLKEELEKRVGGIESIALSQGSVLNSMIRELSVKQSNGTEKKSYLLMLYGDANLPTTMGFELLSDDTPEQLKKRYAYPALVNESYVRTLLPPGTNPIGRQLKEFDIYADSLYTIAGILKDFPFNSLESEITPAILYLPPADKMAKANFLQIKLKPGNRRGTLREIARIVEEVNGESVFQYTDMHKEFMQRNEKVLFLSRILAGYSVIGLALTCFGLFGISWYATRQRIREISIRKVHGATPGQIIWLLNKPFCLRIAIAYVLAIPVTYLLMQHWREQFAYRAPLSVTDFLLPLLIVWIISTVTVCLQGYLLNRTNPIDCIKTE